MGEQCSDRRLLLFRRERSGGTQASGRTKKGLRGRNARGVHAGREGQAKASQTEAGRELRDSRRHAAFLLRHLLSATVQSAAANAHGQAFVRTCDSRPLEHTPRSARARPRHTTAGHRLAPEVPDNSRTTQVWSTLPQRTKYPSFRQNKGKSSYLKLFVLPGPVWSGKHQLVLQGQKYPAWNIAQTVPPPLERTGHVPMALRPLITPTAPPQP